MSWLYSQVLVEEFSEAKSLDGELFVLSSGNPMQLAYLSQDKMTVFSRLSRFGMMFKPLTENLGEELLMWYRDDFLARTLVQQEKEQELKGKNQVCGNTWQGSSEKWNQLTLSLKTPLCFALEDSVLSSKTLPKWGMMRHGECWEQQTLVPTIRGIECGSLQKVPTPTHHNYKEGAYPSEYTRKTPTLATHAGGKLNPMWVEWLMGWPIGWTDLKPLVMDKYQYVQQQLLNN